MTRGALIPDPFRNDREWERFHHLDIPSLADAEARDELNFLSPCLWPLPAGHWLRERASRLEAELARRRYDSGPTGQRKAKLAVGVKP